MKNLFLFILIVFFTTSFISVVGCNNQKSKEQSSVSPKELYELQERCGKEGEEFYKKTFNESTSRLDQNHYNKKLNRCFITVTDFEYHREYLYDVTEHKQLGFIINDDKGIWGSFSQQSCDLRIQCDSLVKPYMTE